MPMKKLFPFFLFLCLCFQYLNAQVIIGRQQAITLRNSTQGSVTNALLWLPEDYNESNESYPLIIYLHGKGETGNTVADLNRLVITGLPMLIAKGFSPAAIADDGKKYNFIVVSPQRPITSAWSYGYPDIKFMLLNLKEKYRIDEKRIYFTGISAGGWGTWTAITDDSVFCKKIAAVVPISAAPLDLSRKYKVINAAKYNIPVWSICGTEDAFWHNAVENINNINVAMPKIPALLTGIKGGVHNPDVWNRVYDTAWKINGVNIYEWMLQYKRDNAIKNDAGSSTKGNDNTITYFEHSDWKGKRIYPLRAGDNGIRIDGKKFHYSPGDTFVLKTSKLPYVSVVLENVNGTPNRPITIINEGGQVMISSNYAVSQGFNLENCSYIKITGTGSASAFYGFMEEEPLASGVGVNITGRSSNIEVCNIYIHNKAYGFWVKQEGNCDDSLQFPNWNIHDISIHDNKIIGMKQEGMYLGSTDPNGKRIKNCNGVASNPKPLRLGNIKVYNNIIDSTYRGGIQLASADYGDNEIYNNHVSNSGFEFNTQQGNGIVLGGYTHAYVHDNFVRKTYTAGIFSLGSGLVRIENNSVDSSGFLAGSVVPLTPSIMVDTRPTDPVEKVLLIIKNNKTGINTDYGIRFFKTFDTYEKGNIICNNTGTITIAKGIDWKSNCDTK